MKKMLLILLLVPALAFSQKIEKTSADPFDSIKTTSTASEILARSPNRLEAFAASFSPTASKLSGIESLKRYAVYMMFIADEVLSVSPTNTTIKVQFADGSIAEYKYKGEFKIFSTSNLASVYFDIDPEDKLFTDPIKLVRISYRDGAKDFELKQNNAELLKKMLSLLKNTI